MEVAVAHAVAVRQGGSQKKQSVAQVRCQKFGAFDIGRQP